MGYTKTDLFDQPIQEKARMFKALGHPARIAILQYLASARICITGDISDEIPLGRTTVNQHLKELKQAGLIQGTTRGASTNYCIDPQGLNRLREVSLELFRVLDFDPECC
jgi:ArsR family transcriptional regulator, arsenate/arsenite/antimonite-responsive transcriptional repressor